MTHTERVAEAGRDRRRAPGVRMIYRSARGRDAIARWCHDQLDTRPTPLQRRVVTAHGASTHVVTAGAGDPTVVVGRHQLQCRRLPAAGHRRRRTSIIDEYPNQLADLITR